jgi:hypothetical protein
LSYIPLLLLCLIGTGSIKFKKETKKMKKKLAILLGGLLAVAMIFGAVRVTTAYAQDATPPAPATGGPGDGHGHGGGPGLGQTELEAAAKVLNITTDELSTALKSGKKLTDLAATAGVDIQDVKDAITAARAVEIRARIQAGVTDGTISQDKATWLLEGLDKGYLDEPGFGFGGPHAGPRAGQPNAQPTQSTHP